MSEKNTSTSSPWFAVSTGLIGLIVGYALATGMTGVRFPTGAVGNPNPDDTTPPSRYASAGDAFVAYAAEIGVDEGDFKSCLDSSKHAAAISADQSAGSDAGIDGTPGFWILGPNGKTKKISGAYPYATFKEVFDQLLTNDAKFVSETGATPPSTGNGPMLGSANATITLIEFTDYQCPFCSRHYNQTYNQIKKDYIDTGKVKFYLRDFPLNFHPNAQKAAEAARCAGDQGKYWEMHDELFSKQSEWSGLPQ